MGYGKTVPKIAVMHFKRIMSNLMGSDLTLCLELV